jgi:hypothetical protein
MRHASVVIVAFGLAVAGCSRFDSAQMSPVTKAAAAESPKLVVYKNATCGCCGLWIEHMRKAGFAAEVHDVDNMSPIKERVGIPYSMGSCHTAQVGGYFVEGHVPAEQVLRMLKEKPKAKGLTVPAMPIGSPGMEQGDVVQPYDVHLVNQDGTTTVYARYPKK